MIRFSAFLVVVAVGTLVAGVVTSKLLLVYIAIGVSGLALLALGAGAAVHWRELTGKTEMAAASGTGAQVPVASPAPAVVPPPAATPEPATAASRPAWSGVSGSGPAGSSRPGYLPPAPRPPAPSQWTWHDDPVPAQPVADKPAAARTDRGDRGSAVAEEQPSIPDEDSAVQDQTMIFRQPDQTMIFRAQPTASTPAISTDEPEPSPAEPAAAVEAEETTATARTAAEESAEESAAAETAPSAGDAQSAADASAPADAAPEPAAEEDAPAKAAAEPAAKLTSVPETAPVPVPADDALPAGSAASSADEPEPADDDATTITKAAAPASGAASAADMEVTVVPGVPRYHRGSCILIRFMGDSDLDKMTVAAAKEAGCTPCRACLPDQPEGSPE